MVRLIDLGGYGQLFRHRFQKKILARLAAILVILSVSRECIDILNIFYKKVFHSAPLSRGDRLILRSRGSFLYCICTVSDTVSNNTTILCLHCVCTAPVLHLYCTMYSIHRTVRPQNQHISASRRSWAKNFFIENVQYTYTFTWNAQNRQNTSQTSQNTFPSPLIEFES